MGDPEQDPPSSDAPPAANPNPSSNSDHLVLFSVIVALAPRVDISSIPISGWFEGSEDDRWDLNQSLHRFHSSASLSSGDGFGSHVSVHDSSRASASFLAIRRVQVSLARLCRVLEREEKRCRYISIQSNQFFRIRSELQKKWEEKAASNSQSTNSSKPSTTGNSPKSDLPKKGQGTKKTNQHRRGSSFSQTLLTSSVSLTGGHDGSKDRLSQHGKNHSFSNLEHLQDTEQEILEHLLAVGPTGDVDTVKPGPERRHHGNLGRELVQVFHALSRNDHNFPPSATVLTGREGIVYVNRHLAVALEPASLPKSLSPSNMGSPIVRPYHTLLFPHASPSQLLQALQSSGFTAPLQQLLLMVRPSKPLADIAVDANLPLATVMELAMYLVSHGACVASPILTRASRLACNRVDKIQELALDFSQTFNDWSVSLFPIVSFLTTDGRTLGESMMALTRGEDAIGAFLRAAILSTILHEEGSDDYVFVEGNGEETDSSASGYESPATPDERKQQAIPHHRAEELEEVLYSMAIWLLSHQVLGHIQDYLILAAKSNRMNQATANDSSNAETDTEKGGMVDETIFDDGLLKELNDSDCLYGSTSIVATSWRLGLDATKLRSWATRHDKLRVVSRLAAKDDDWGAV